MLLHALDHEKHGRIPANVTISDTGTHGRKDGFLDDPGVMSDPGFTMPIRNSIF